MNDIIKQKQVSGQMNHQTAEPKANASVFLFFSKAHFLKTILASRTNGTTCPDLAGFGIAPTHKADPSAKKKSHFFAITKKNINITNKKGMRQTILLLIFFVALSGCNNVQARLDKAEKELVYAEQNKEDMSNEDWTALETKMLELESDLEQNRDKYTDEQVKEIGKLQGRYYAVAVKKGINDFQESVKDLGNQMEGFIEGIKSDTNNKTNENE